VRTPAKKYKFAYALAGLGAGWVDAYTRSHAKALAKKKLGIPRHKRLPMHFEMIQVTA
jgi:hypothetical protein